MVAERATRLIKQCYEELEMSKPSLTCNQRAAEAIEIARRKAQQEGEATTEDVEMVAKPTPGTRPGVSLLFDVALEFSCKFD